MAHVLPAGAQERFQFRDGDRVALIGDTLIEREPEFGALEAALTLAAGDRGVTFRNLGWSADTPEGESRTSFAPAAQGPDFLRDHLALVKPTVAIIGYGMASSFDGEQGLARFREQLRHLVTLIHAQAPGGRARLVFLSPIAHEALGGRWPDPAAHNRDLQRYSAVVAEVARESGGWHVPLFSALKPAGRPLTGNGIHLNREGYASLAQAVLGELGLATPAQSETLTHTDPRLPALRALLAEKNRLFFHRFRPQNSMYLFLARRYEQGRNAGEIPRFDPLVDAKEREIAALVRDGAGPAPARAPEIAPAAPATPAPPARLETLPELEVTLFAQTPQLTKPIAMNFDAQGRLWVAASEIYPQIAPGQPASDKIFVLEDRDRDGKADSGIPVFAADLLVPTGIEPGDGGVYVGASTELRFLQDTDGDGAADERTIVLSGFGTEDAHHNIHTLRWGPDGHLYFNQAIYTHSHIETPHGVVRQRSGGIFRFDPRSGKLSVLVHGLVNPWGHAFDRFGQSFATDGAGAGGINYLIPGATYQLYTGLRRQMASISPGSYPKFAGLELVFSDHFPAEWQGRAITADFRANNVVQFALREDGAGFGVEPLGRIVWSADRNFRPVDIKLGPDGALYIADWSNPVIQHGEVDFRSATRDKISGHIWRLAYKGRPATPPAASPGDVAQLFPRLLQANDDQRRQARRLLAERGAEMLPAARAWAERTGTDAARLEVLWLIEAAGQVDRPWLEAVLRAGDGRIRAAATRIAAHWTPRLDNPLALFERLLADEHPRARMEALRALGRLPQLAAVDLAFATLQRSPDRFSEYALWLTINDLAETWTKAVEEGRWPVAERLAELDYGAKAIEPRLGERVLRTALRDVTFAADGSGPWIELIGKIGSPDLQQMLFERVTRREFNDTGAERALAALVDSAQRRNVQPAGDKAALLRLPYDAGAVQLQVVKLIGAWQVPGAAPTLLRLASATDRPAELRRAALDGLRRIGDTGQFAELKALATRKDPAIWREAVFTSVALDATRGAGLFLDWMAADRTPDEATEGWRDLFRLRGAVTAVVTELAKRTLPDSAAQAGLRVAREQADKGVELAARLNREPATPNPAGGTGLRPQDIPALVARLKDGDPVRGEQIYRRPELACVACHALGGVGGKVGPDLSTIGTAAPADYIVESIVAPGEKVKDGYQSIVLRTAEQEISGVLEREDATQIFLRDGAGHEVAVPKSRVRERTLLASMMPPGLIDALPAQDRVDLLRFLTELGKPPFDASSQKVARAWEAYAITGEPTAAEIRDLLKTAGLPVYAGLDGKLRPEDLAATGLKFPVLLTTRFHASREANAEILTWGNRPAVAWVDDRSVTRGTTAHFGFRATPGEHRFTMRLDVLAGELTVSSEDVTFVAP